MHESYSAIRVSHREIWFNLERPIPAFNGFHKTSHRIKLIPQVGVYLALTSYGQFIEALVVQSKS